jgi:alpha-N-acetylglucosaminidase
MGVDPPLAPPLWRPGPGRWDVLAGLAARVTATPVSFVALGDDGSADGRRYAVRASPEGLLVRASDAGAAAYGLHQHLLHRERRRVCWDTALPLAPAAPDDRSLQGTLGDAAGYYLNFCTYGYTAPFWDWERWQREIDWMALHGITMPLALVGHEAALAQAYRAVGLGEEQIRAFLGAAPYLPWQFMGCLDGWGTPMSSRWLDERAALGARVMERMLDYGMTPVLPAFVGHVPAELARHDTTTRDWWGFTTHLLDPHDDRFADLARLVVEAQRDLFGTAHLYAADPFIEMAPPDDDPGYLGALTGAVLGGLRAADPQAVWVMQAWTFGYLDWWTDERVAAFLDSVPDDALLVLDLWGEHAPQWRRFGGFRGKPWIWCALHDFGGRGDTFGALASTVRERADAMACADAPIGIGLAMEATEQNHVLYELVAEREPPSAGDLPGWIGEYAMQRYGVGDPRLAAAWRRLLDTVYAAPAERLLPTERPSSVTLRPGPQLTEPGWLADQVAAWSWYEPAQLVEAGELLLGVLDDHPELFEAELGHDAVAVAATAMARGADLLLLDAVRAAHAPGGDLPAAGGRFLDLLDELDAVLDLQPSLRLATWEAAAAAADPASLASAPAAARDARRLLTVWNHSERAPLTDYAARLWSGLVGGLYRERWRAWFDALDRARVAGAPVDWDRLDTDIEAITAAFVDDGPAPRPPQSVRPLTLVRRALGACTTVLARPPAATTPFPQEHQR